MLPIVATRHRDGQFIGVAAELSRELAKRLGVAVEFSAAASPSAAVDLVKDNQADITFLVDLAARAAHIAFGASYIAYETTFLVPGDAAIRTIADVDAPGRVVIVPEKSAIAAKLGQAFKNVRIVGVPIAAGSAARVIAMLRNGEADGLQQSHASSGANTAGATRVAHRSGKLHAHNVLDRVPQGRPVRRRLRQPVH
jgi:polar amino acid transport system substrate-binding protein